MKGTKNCLGQRGRLTAALMKGRPWAKGPRNTEESEVMNRVKALQGQLMMEFKRNHIILPPATSSRHWDSKGTSVARLPSRGRVCYPEPHGRGQCGPLWAALYIMVVRLSAVHASLSLSCVHEHQDGKRVGWKVWSRGQGVPFPAKALMEVTRTNLSTCKQTPFLRLADVPHLNTF